MEELFLAVLKSAYDKTGWIGLLITGGAFSIAMITYQLCKESIKPIINKIFNKPKNPVPQLNEHLIFKKYDFIRDIKLPQIKLKCPLRRHIFTRLISIRLQSHKKSALDFVNNGEYSELTTEQLKLVVREFVYGSRNAWILAAHAANIPEVVLRKYTERTADIKNIIYDTIDTICSSTTIYPSNLHKLNGILDVLMTLEEHLYIFLEQVLDMLNGELSKIEYEGIKCNACNDCPHKHLHHQQIEVAKPSDPIYMVLYVEDDLNSIAFLPKNLMANGLRTVIARSATEMRSLLSQRKFDAVILGDTIADGRTIDLIPALKIINMPFIFATASGLSPMEGYIAHNKFNNTKAISDSVRKQIETVFYSKKIIEPTPLVVFLGRDRLIGDSMQPNAIKYGIEMKASISPEEVISWIQEHANVRKVLVVVDDMIGENTLSRVSGCAMNSGVPMTLYGQSNGVMRHGEHIISRNLTMDAMLTSMVSIINGRFSNENKTY